MLRQDAHNKCNSIHPQMHNSHLNLIYRRTKFRGALPDRITFQDSSAVNWDWHKAKTMCSKNIFTYNPPTIERAADFVLTSHRVSTTVAQKSLRRTSCVSESVWQVFAKLVFQKVLPTIKPLVCQAWTLFQTKYYDTQRNVVYLLRKNIASTHKPKTYKIKTNRVE